jgi:hypothetical protein
MSELDDIAAELERRLLPISDGCAVELGKALAHAILLAEERAAARIKRQLPVFEERGAKPDHIGDANKMMPDPRAASPLLPLLLGEDGRPTRELARMAVADLNEKYKPSQRLENDPAYWVAYKNDEESLLDDPRDGLHAVVAILDAWHGVGGEK